MGIIVKNIFLAIPFYFIWNFLAPIYLVNLWPEYRNVPFWHIVGIFTLISILRLALFPKAPSPSRFQFRTFRFNPAGNGGFQDYRQADPDYSQQYSHIKDVTPKKSE
jgi:hypothetical protein